jgi:hypothetical protein
MEKSVAFWRDEIPRRAQRWANEDAEAREAHVAKQRAAARRRAADWPIERIRVLMADAEKEQT